MTTITAKIIADSISEAGKRITTMQLRYPRFIHAEFMTHRMFSRNASSSRAIPIERLIQDIIDDTAMPLHWGAAQKGMQADKECDASVRLPFFGTNAQEPDKYDGLEVWSRDFSNVPRNVAWLEARDKAIEVARSFSDAGYHKQVANRLLEPFAHINVLVTATEWANFFALRDHADAEPHIAMLARAMKEAMDGSTPVLLPAGHWHLPFVTENDRDAICFDRGRAVQTLEFWKELIKISVARCARVSYLTQDGKRPLIEQDLALYDRLVGSAPLHASPAEHQATPDEAIVNTPGSDIVWRNPHLHGNFVGMIQFRKTLPNENIVA